jgi:hypothetical protein
MELDSKMVVSVNNIVTVPLSFLSRRCTAIDMQTRIRNVQIEGDPGFDGASEEAK